MLFVSGFLFSFSFFFYAMNTIHTSERGIRGKANIVLTLFSPLFFRHFTLCPLWLCPMLQHLCWPFVLSSQ